MKESEITALAREYAEEIYSGGAEFIDEVEQVICWLSQRFCLVEKSKVKQIYQAKQRILANQNVFGITVATEAAAQKRLMLCLFPDFRKEVEE